MKDGAGTGGTRKRGSRRRQERRLISRETAVGIGPHRRESSSRRAALILDGVSRRTSSRISTVVRRRSSSSLPESLSVTAQLLSRIHAVEGNPIKTQRREGPNAAKPQNGTGRADRKITDRKMGFLFIFMSSIFLSLCSSRLCGLFIRTATEETQLTSLRCSRAVYQTLNPQS